METKKMKYYLRKTAVGLAAVSAAFLISSTRVLAEGPTVTDADSELTLSDAERNLENAKTKLSALDLLLADTNEEIKRIEAAKNAAEQKFNEAKNEHKEYTDRLAGAEKKLREAYEALNAAGTDEGKKKEANKKIAEANAENIKVSNDWNANRARVEKEVSDAETEVVKNERDLAQFKNSLSELETSKQETEEKIAKLEKEVAAEKDAQNLARHRKDVLEDLINLESGSNFVADIKDAAGKAIASASSIQDIDSIMEKAKEDIKNRKEALGNPETEEDLKKAKDAANEVLAALAADVESPEAGRVINDAFDKVDAAGTTSAVTAIVEEAKENVERIKEEAKAKEAVDNKEKEDAQALLNKVKAEAKETLKEAGVGEFYLKKIDSAKTVEGVNALKDLILQSRPKAVPENAPTVDEKPKANPNKEDNSGITPGKDLTVNQGTNQNPKPEVTGKEVKPSEGKGKTLSRVEAKHSDNKKESLPKTGATSSVITTIFGLGSFISSLGLAFPRRRKN